MNISLLSWRKTASLHRIHQKRCELDGYTDDLSGPGNHDMMDKKQNNLIGRAGGSGVRNGTCHVKEALARLAKEKSKKKKEKKLRNNSRRPTPSLDDFSVSIADLSKVIWTASSPSAAAAAAESSSPSMSYSPRTRTVANIHCENDDAYTNLYSDDRGNIIDMLLFTIIEEDPESEVDSDNENIDVVGSAVEVSCQQYHQQNPSMQPWQHSLLEMKDGVTAINSVPPATAVVVTASVPLEVDGRGGAINGRNIYHDKVLPTTIMTAETANKKVPSVKASKRALAEASESIPATTTNTQSESTPSLFPKTRGQRLPYKNDALSSIDDPKDFHPPLPSMIVIEERNECNARDHPHYCNDSALFDVAVSPHIMNINNCRSWEDKMVMTPLTDNVDEIIHREEESSCSSYSGSNPSNLTEEQNDFIDLIDDSDSTESDALGGSLSLLSLFYEVQSHASTSNDAQRKVAIGGGDLGQDHRSLVGSSGSDLVFDVPEIITLDSDLLQDDVDSHDSDHRKKNDEDRTSILIKMETIPKKTKREEEPRSCNKNVELGCVPSNDVFRNVDNEARVVGQGSRKRREKNQQDMVGNTNIGEAKKMAGDNAEHPFDQLIEQRIQSRMKSSETPANDPTVSPTIKSCPPHISLKRGSLRTKNDVTLETTKAMAGGDLEQDHRSLVGSSGSDLVFDVPEITMLDSDLLQDDVDSHDSDHRKKHDEARNSIRIKMETIPKKTKREEEPRSCNKNVELGCVPSNDVFRNDDNEARVVGPSSRKRREKNQQDMVGNTNIGEAKKMAGDNAEHPFDQMIEERIQSRMKSSETPANDPKVSSTLRKSCPPHISLKRGSLRTKNDIIEATNYAGTRRGTEDAESIYPANTCSREWVANERNSHNTGSVVENGTQAKVGFISKKSVLKKLPNVKFERSNSCPPLISWMKRDEMSEATNIAASMRGIENNQDLECAVEPCVSISLSETNEKLHANNKHARFMSDLNILPRSNLVQPDTNHFSDVMLETLNYAETKRGSEGAESNSPANTCSKDWITDEKMSRNTGSVVENVTQAKMGFTSKKSVLKKLPHVMLEKVTSIIPSDTLATCHSFPSKVLSQRLQLAKDNHTSKDLDWARLRKRTQGFDRESSPGIKSSARDSVSGRSECSEEQETVIVNMSNRPRNSHVAFHQHKQHQQQHTRNKSSMQDLCASNATSSRPSSNSISFSDLPGCHLHRHDDGSITKNIIADDGIRRGQCDTHISWEELGYAIESCMSISLLEMNEKVHANNNYARSKRDSSINSRPDLFQTYTNHHTRQQESCYYSGGQGGGHDVSWDELSDAITEGRMKSINDITRQVVEKQQEWGLVARRKGSQHHEGVADEPWQCATCTFVNQHGSFLVCDICGTPKYQVIGGNVIERKCRHRTDNNRRGSSPT